MAPANYLPTREPGPLLFFPKSKESPGVQAPGALPS